MVQAKDEVHKILSQPRDIWEIVDKTQIKAAKTTRLVIHSSKRKGRTLYTLFLGIAVLAQLQGVISLAKPEKQH